MAVTAPDEIEWEGLLISPTRPSVDGLWMSSRSRMDEWSPSYSFDDLPTAAGAAPGRRVALPMRPSISGLCVASADDLATLEASIGVGDLEWWDRPRDAVASVSCELRIVEPSHDRTDALAAHRTVYVEWFIGRPGEIDWGGSS